MNEAMQLTKEQKAEIMPIYEKWWHSYLNGDVKTYDHYLDDHYRFVGSTEAEDFLNKLDTTKFFDDTAEQLAGKTQKRNSKLTTEYYDGIVFITELADAYLLFGDEWTFYGKFRFSSMLRKRPDGWRFIYQHFSVPDSKAQEGETIGFEQVSKENQELRDAIKRRTAELENKNRELEIETALERVRARTMAMQHSNELTEASEILDEQVRALGIQTWGSAFHIYADDPEGDYEWFSSREGSLPFYKTPREEFFLKFYNKGKAGETFHVEEFIGEDCKDHYEYLMSLPVIGDALREIVASGGSLPDSQYDHVAFFKHGFVLFITYEPVPEAHDIFKRFAKVFEQAYTRFLDLKKAEAQAREAKIETALEKVRSRSLAMHNSDELNEVVKVLFEKMTELEVPSTAIGIQTFSEDSKDVQCFICGDVGTGMVINQYLLPYFDHPIINDYLEAHEKNPEYYVGTYSKKEKDSLYDVVLDLPELKDIPTEVKTMIRESEIYEITMVPAKKSVLAVNDFTGNPLSENQINILKRFSKVFDQAYTRYLDLQNVEERAREAQIEAAIERVRSRSMGMQKSEDLIDVVQQIGHELKEMGIEVHNSQIWTDILVDPPGSITIWIDVEGQSYLEKFHFPLSDHPIDSELSEAIEKDLPLFSSTFSKSEIESYFKYAFNETDLKRIPQERKDIILNAPGWTRCTVLLDEACLHFQRFNLDEFTDNEKEVFKRFGKVFSQAYTRFLDLQKAEEQARESQIEAALERVRARSMGMHHSTELIEVVRILDREIKGLGIQSVDATQILTDLSDPNDGMNVWLTVEEMNYLKKFHIPYNDHPIISNLFKQSLKDENFYTETYSKTEKNRFFQWLFKHSDFRSIPVNRKEVLLNSSGLVRSTVIHANSALVFQHNGLNEFSKVDNAIFKRFGAVFEQAYTRFLDLQKAEEQAREAQIEGALEKVRSRSMGMQSSDELHQVINIVSEQLTALDIEFDTANFIEINEDGSWEIWIAVEGQDYAPKIHVPYYDCAMMNEFIIAKKKGVDLYQNVFSFEEKNEFFTHFFTNTAAGKIAKERKQYVFDGETNTVSIFATKSPALGISKYTPDPFTDEENEIFRRFANVFEQAYTRFLDLQKAEKQAREAKIEAALEKVRSRSMGMQSSDELPEVANLLFLEVQALGIPAWSCGYNILNDDKRTAAAWMSSEGTLQEPFTLRLFGESSFDEMGEFVLSDEPILVQELGGKELEEHYEHMKSFPDLRPTFENIESQGLSLPTYQINHLCRFSHGFLLFITYEPVPDAHEIFKRFTKVFDQTYTRFLDLKRAEKQAAEAIKQASLDRVRGQIASMRSTDDLENITPLIWNELKTLGISFIRCGVFIIHEDEQEAEVYLSKPDGTSLAVMHLPIESNELVTTTVEAWRNKDVYKEHWSREKFLEWGQSMMEQGQVPDLKSYQGAEEAPESLHLHFIPFDQGMLYIGSTEPLDDEAVSLSESLAKAFSIAYARYEDFVKLEKAKAGIEEALTELKATQTQLIQQEKLASLGQLTAGIAHEIKNPLNFVNNFSELSVELIQEAREEIRRWTDDRRPEDDNTLILEIINDIEMNLKKIYEHGSRADGIVKSMLEHSRGGSGKPEPTNLNALVKEFTNLSFHGMRASKEPISVDMKYELDESIGELPLVAEDFSRVIVNLCNNAFDALREKANVKREIADPYEPKLTVRTQSKGSSVILEIEDNGPGIPEEMKDKIMQPFFTTKKGTQGTGLGLSITNDIVKAHGGSLDLRTTVNRGTIFTIKLTS